MDYKGIRLKIDDDGIAVVTMCNKDYKFAMDYVETWNQVLDDIESVKVQNGAPLDAEAARSLGIVALMATEDNLMSKAKITVINATGKLSVNKEFFNDMKSELCNGFVVQEKLKGK